MTIAERRAANRHRVAASRGDSTPQVSGLRADGLTGAEVLEIWSRTASIASPPRGEGGRPARLELRRG